MPHAHLASRLPSPAVAFARFKGFTAGLSRQGVVLDELRRVARRLQRAQPTPFYSMREVSRFFALPLRSVALNYATLEQEGLLVRLRGAHTKLTGRKASPKNPVRSVVGLPIWISSIASSPYMRTLHVDINERLRRHGFVADSIFFNSREDLRPEFADRLQAHRLDWVLWLGANFMSSPVFLALRDRGLRQIIVLPEETPLSLPLPVYLQDWKKAYQSLASSWAAAGIRRLLVPPPVDTTVTRRVIRHFSGIMKAQKIAVEILASNGPGNFVREAALACRRPDTAVAFLDMVSAHEICNGYPQAMADIARTNRLGFCRGAVPVAYFSQESVVADVVGCDPLELSCRIVDDLASQSVRPSGVCARFDAIHHPLVNFATYREPARA